MRDIREGTALLVTFYMIGEQDGEPMYSNIGELLVEENPQSAERVEGLQGYLAYFEGIDGERIEGQFGGFHRSQGAEHLLLEGLRVLGIGQP